MSAMDIAEHIEVLQADGQRMAAAIGEAAPDASVPSCPDWAVRDLVYHQGSVHRWATAYVAGAITERTDVDFEGAAGPKPSDGELVEWFGQGHRDLVAALSTASPDLQCWSFMAAPSPLAFWSRRQAHETSIHRVDAEQAAGRAGTPVPAAFAADGIDELLTGFVVRRKPSVATESRRTLTFACVDTDASWRMTIEGETMTAQTGGSSEAADCTVRGGASDLYHALWNRRGLDGLEIAGDPSVLELMIDGARI
jgi:uncharacterized protein (TIGR03083 family)